MDAAGVFYQMPKSSDGAPLPRQSVTLFNDSFNKDKFENTAWTVNGQIGQLKAVYTGAYLVRNVSADAGLHQLRPRRVRRLLPVPRRGTCQRPDSDLLSRRARPGHDTERNTHQSHEIRLSTPDDWRLRGIVGGFWEKLQIEDRLNWLYKTMPSCTDSVTAGCLTDVAPAPGSTVDRSEHAQRQCRLLQRRTARL